MHAKPFVGVALLACLAGCSSRGTDAPPAAKAADISPAKPSPPGSDRDAHGCIPSAGYTWCATTTRCERPWELAKNKGFENTSQAFDKFCATPSQ